MFMATKGRSVAGHQTRVLWIRAGESQADAAQIDKTIHGAVSKLVRAIEQRIVLSFIPRTEQSNAKYDK
jgi:hypothetical protein